MRSRLLAVSVTVGITFFLWAISAHPVDGQVAGQSLAERCSGRNPEDLTMATISTAFGLVDSRGALAALDALEGPVRAAALAAPHDAGAQYHWAALLGARTEREEGRRKISAAKTMHPQALRVIAIEPGHPGANYLMGRLHAGVMRLNRVTRFLATHLLGGNALRGASWSASQTFFEVAERGAPCQPEHHYELARLYGERNERAAAEHERQHVLELTTGPDGRWAAIRIKAARLSAVWMEKDR